MSCTIFRLKTIHLFYPWGGGGRGDNSCSDKMSPLPPPTLQKSNKSLKLLLCNSRRFGLLEIRMDGETLQWMSKFLGYYF